MTALDLARANLLSPVVLCFALGVLAARLRSDLKIPEQVFSALSIYLMLAIGLKGGAELAQTSIAAIAAPLAAALALGLAIPLWSYAGLRRFGRFGVADAAALAAHYGSVSAVTFVAVQAYLDAIRLPYEGFSAALLAIMEVPAIVVALALARRAGAAGSQGLGRAVAEVFAGKSIVLLVGGLAIGALSGPEGIAPVRPFFTDLFRGALCLFLLELGISAASRLSDLRRAGPALVAFALAAPILHGWLGVLAGWLVGLSEGGAVVLGTLAASASYIAAPAAVRLALPEANPGLYLTASLAITFPFNLAFGLPLYRAFAAAFYA